MTEFSLVPDLYLEVIKEQAERLNKRLEWATEMLGVLPEPTPEEKERWRLEDAWKHKREEEAYVIAPWLRAEVERDDW